MRKIQIIRSRLGLTQAELGAALGCSQMNVSYYERGQDIPPAVAGKLIAVAAERGLAISFDHIYGSLDVPRMPHREVTS